VNLSFYDKENKKDLPSESAMYYPINVGLPSIESGVKAPKIFPIVVSAMITVFFSFPHNWKYFSTLKFSLLALYIIFIDLTLLGKSFNSLSINSSLIKIEDFFFIFSIV
jgi:hypothetical protein